VGDSVVRRIKQILEIVGFEPETNELITNTVYEWDPSKDAFNFKGHSFLFDNLMELKNLTHEEMDAEFQRRVAVVKYLVEQKMTDHRQIWKMVTSYYRDATEVMTQIGYRPEVAA
ncbi:MAG: secretion system protein E, partial [Deltaproteobacteria bacterium]|nr:secretion system protein E [Deltaproteobacteria bacterium]